MADDSVEMALNRGNLDSAIRRLAEQTDRVDANAPSYQDKGDVTGEVVMDCSANKIYRFSLTGDTQMKLVAPPEAGSYVSMKLLYHMGDTTANSGNPWQLYWSGDFQNVSFPNHDAGFNLTDDMNQNEYGIVMLEFVGDRWLVYQLAKQVEID